MKTLIVISLLTLADGLRAQTFDLVPDSAFLRAHLHQRVWILPSHQRDVLALNGVDSNAVSTKLPARFTPFDIEDIRFAQGARPLILVCKANGKTYVLPSSYDQFAEVFSETNPQPKYKGWSKRVWNAIDDGSVFIGMTKEQVRLSRGEPDDINRTITRSGTSEQWVYSSYRTQPSYLYFEGSTLNSIQD